MHTNFSLESLKGTNCKPRYRWQDYIEMDNREIGLEGVGCIHLGQDKDW
jgi:hypothetical protein